MNINTLYQKNVLKNIIGWQLATDPIDDVYETYEMVSLDYAKSLKAFIKANPNHVISLYYKDKVLPDDLEEKKLKATQDLWKKYLSLRENKLPADDEYYEKFDHVIDVLKEINAHFGLKPSNQMHYNDGALGSQKDILITIEKMAEISKEFLKDKPKNETEPLEPVSLDNITQYIDKFKDIDYRISKKNGSFMTQITKDDSRIHILENFDDMHDVASSVYHECGHGLYQTRILNQNTQIGQLGDCVSLSLHESSSILFENALSGFDFNVKQSKNNLYRLSTDRIHYIIHIYIRLKIEDMLLNDKIKSKDISKVWNSLVEEYIGITPENDWEGFLQDVHWNDGAFGYFQSYAIGFLNAVTLYQNIQSSLTGNPYEDSVNVLLPSIEKWYGHYNEKSTNILKNMHPNIDKTLDSYREFIFKNFNYVD
jgi:hypothetical protein